MFVRVPMRNPVVLTPVDKLLSNVNNYSGLLSHTTLYVSVKLGNFWNMYQIYHDQVKHHAVTLSCTFNW